MVTRRAWVSDDGKWIIRPYGLFTTKHYLLVDVRNDLLLDAADEHEARRIAEQTAREET